MATARVLIAATLAALLAGCAPDTAQLEADNRALQTEVAKLRQQVAEDAGTRFAEMSYYEHQASIAAGCDWLLPLCPAAVANTGRQAQAAGYGGGADWPFWLAVVLKLIGIGALSGALLGTLSWAWYRHAMPARAEAEAAYRAIEEAQGRTADAARRAKAAEADEEAARRRVDAALAELAQVQRATTQAKRELGKATAELEGVKAARAALDAF